MIKILLLYFFTLVCLIAESIQLLLQTLLISLQMRSKKNINKNVQRRTPCDINAPKAALIFKIHFDFSPRKIACFIQEDKPSCRAVVKKEIKQASSNESTSSCENSPRDATKQLEDSYDHEQTNLLGGKEVIELSQNSALLQLEERKATQEIKEKEKETISGETSQMRAIQPAKHTVVTISQDNAFQEPLTYTLTQDNTQLPSSYHNRWNSNEVLYTIVPEQIFYDSRLAIMIKNIPYWYSLEELAALINYEFNYCYDFLYLPMRTMTLNAGYAIINFVSHHYLYAFYYRFQGAVWPVRGSKNKYYCQLFYSRLQGYEKLVDDLKNNRMNWSKKSQAISNRDFTQVNQLIRAQQTYYC